jgi:hypothetical protein
VSRIHTYIHMISGSELHAQHGAGGFYEDSTYTHRRILPDVGKMTTRPHWFGSLRIPSHWREQCYHQIERIVVTIRYTVLYDLARSNPVVYKDAMRSPSPPAAATRKRKRNKTDRQTSVPSSSSSRIAGKVTL